MWKNVIPSDILRAVLLAIALGLYLHTRQSDRLCWTFLDKIYISRIGCDMSTAFQSNLPLSFPDELCKMFYDTRFVAWCVLLAITSCLLIICSAVPRLLHIVCSNETQDYAVWYITICKNENCGIWNYWHGNVTSTHLRKKLFLRVQRIKIE